ELSWENGTPAVKSPVNMTKKAGYDNQPCFNKDGKSFFFTAIHQDTTQSDIYYCDLEKRTIGKFTKTPVSEYSPQLSPDGSLLGVVRVDADSGQRFYTIPVEEPRMAFHHEGSDSIGYFTFLTDTTIAMFILGEQGSLQLLELPSGQRKKICASIGRCMKTDKERKNLYFMDKTVEPIIMRMDVYTSAFESVAKPISGSEDFEILKDGSIIMGSDGKLFRLEKEAVDWVLIADLSASVGQFYRIAVDADNKRIAFVAYSGKRP
ncbi:MAG: TolB family protein, partial [Bacteroidota bacterium]